MCICAPLGVLSTAAFKWYKNEENKLTRGKGNRAS